MTEEIKPKRGRKPKEVKPVGIPVVQTEADQRYLQMVGFDAEWLQAIGSQYGFDKFQYLHKFRAFRCYRNEAHLDWIDINALSILNGGRQLDKIMLKHQPLSEKRRVIQYPWQ